MIKRLDEQLIKQTDNSLHFDDELCSIGKAAKFLKVSIDSLRRWEKRGLITPQKTQGGTRYYPLDQLKALKSKAQGKLRLSKLIPSEEETEKKQIPQASSADESLSYIKSEPSTPFEQAVRSVNHLALAKELETLQISNSANQKAASQAFNFPVSSILTTIGLSLTTLGVLATGLLTGGYLTNPNLASKFSSVEPFNSLAKGYISLVLPQKASELGFNQSRNLKEQSEFQTQEINPSLNVLAATSRIGTLTINTNTNVAGSLTISGDLVFSGGKVQGLVQTINGGDNITISNADPSNPIISVSLPTNLVNSFATSTTGTKVSGDIILGSGLSLATSTKTISVSTPTLSDVRSAGGCSGCIKDDDVESALTISSSGSVDVGALSGKVTTAKGGLGGDVTPAGAGELLYSTSTSAYDSLAAGTSTYVLTSGGAGAPVWVAQSSLSSSTAFSSLTSGTNTQAAMVVSTGASLTYNGGTATSGVINANQLLGGTWAAPGAIGSTTPSTGAFTTLTAGTGTFTINSTGALTAATGITSSGTITFSGLTTGRPVITTTGGELTTEAQLAVARGGTNGTATPTAGAIAYGTGTAYAFSLAGSSGQVLLSGATGSPTWIDQSGISASASFTNITSGTNTTAAMVVGSGATLGYTGTGTIDASSLVGATWIAPGTIGSTTANTGKFTTLNTTTALQINGTQLLDSSRNITNMGTIMTNTFTSTALTFGGADPVITGTTTLSLNTTSGTGSILLGGGSGSTGCTVNDSTGDLTCVGSITGGSTGSQGYWGRSVTTLSPVTSGDSVTTSGNISATGTGAITSGGTLTASNGLTLTTGALSLTATSGSAALTLTSSVTAFNINSGLFNVDTTGSKVGIGDESPDAKLDIDSSSTTGGDFLITNTGVGLSGTIAGITANSVTTGDIVTLSATALSSGSLLIASGPTSTGVTDHFVKLSSDIGSAASLLNLNPDFSGSAVTGYGVYNIATDATANGNTDYGYYGSLALSGNAAKTGVGLYSTVTSSSTTGDTLVALDLATSATGALSATQTRTIYGIRSQPASTGASANADDTLNLYGSYLNPSSTLATAGTDNVYGQYITTTATHAVDAGTLNQYGLYIANGTSSTNGTAAKYGLYVETPTGADTNYAAVFAGGNVGVGLTGPGYKLDIATSTASDRGVNIANTAATGTNYGIYSSVTGAATANIGGYFVATGATTSRGLEVAALTSATSTGLTIGALSGTTANTGISVGTLSGSGASSTGLTIGAISSTGANQRGILLSTLTGGTNANYQLQVGAITSIDGAANSFLNLGAITGGGATATNVAMDVGNISATGGNDFGIRLGTLTGGTTANYQITTGVLTSATTDTNAQLNLGGVVTTGGTTNYGINVGALSGTGTTNYGININASTAVGTTNYGMKIGAISGAASGTNYGLYVDTVSGAGANYAAVFAGGNVGIGTATPGSAMDVIGASRASTYFSGSSGNTNIRATGTTAGNTSNASIYFQDSSGNTKGRLDTQTIGSFGTGADGACTIASGSTNIQSASCAGRATADGIATALSTTASAGATTLTIASCTGIATNDEVLIIQMTGTGAGSYETRKVSSCSSGTLTLTTATANTYTNDGSSKPQVVRIPQYSTVSITGTMTVTAWAGTTGGVAFFRASGSVTVNSGGVIDLKGLGGAGGSAGSLGAGGAGTTQPTTGVTGSTGSSGSAGTGFASGAGSGGTAAGGGGLGGSQSAAVGGGGGAGGTGGGGAGGAHATANAGSTGVSGAGGSGGGGAAGRAGPGGAGAAGAGGSAGSTYGAAALTTIFLGSGGGGGAGGAGGGGGSGGAGGTTGGNGGVGGGGGAGGGILYIASPTVTNSGTIRASGNLAGDGETGAPGGDTGATNTSAGGGGAGGAGGGGGAGGSIFIQANSVTVGTLSASGGNGGSGQSGGRGGSAALANAGNCAGGGGAGTTGGAAGADSSEPCTFTPEAAGTNAAPGTGGAGGDGRVRIEAPTISGSSTPTASTASTIASLTGQSGYGTLYIGATNTSSADLAEYYVSGDKSVEAGDVVVISNKKVLDDNSEEILTHGVLRKSQVSYEPTLVGVISTDPGLVLGSVDGDTQKSDQRVLALKGRVPIKVNGEGGSIHIGDYLTSSSTPGVAMKATHPGQIIAVALEDYEGTEVSKIEGFINLSFADPQGALNQILVDTDGSLITPNLKIKTLRLTEAGGLTAKNNESGGLVYDMIDIGTKIREYDTILANNALGFLNLGGTQASQSAQLAGLSNKLLSIEDKVSGVSTQSAQLTQEIESSIASLSKNTLEVASHSAAIAELKTSLNNLNLTPLETLLATDSATLSDLKVTSDATISGKLTALGDVKLGDTLIAGNLAIDGFFSIASNAINVIGTSLGDNQTPTDGILYLQNSPLSNLIDLFNGQVTISKDGLLTVQKLAVSNQSLDTVVIEAGSTSIEVTSSELTDKSKIFVSATLPIPIAVTNKDVPEHKFTISLGSAQSSNVSIDWWIVDQK